MAVQFQITQLTATEPNTGLNVTVADDLSRRNLGAVAGPAVPFRFQFDSNSSAPVSMELADHATICRTGGSDFEMEPPRSPEPGAWRSQPTPREIALGPRFYKSEVPD